MDLNLLAAVQHFPENQFRFDADAHDQAVLRADKLRSLVGAGWKWLEAQPSAIANKLCLIANLATAKRAW